MPPTCSSCPFDSRGFKGTWMTLALWLLCAAARAAAPAPPAPTGPQQIEIRQGTVGVVGGWRVGVASVSRSGTPAPALRATVVVLTYSSGVAAEFTLELAAHQLAPFGDGLHRVLGVYPGDSRARGRVVIARTPEEPAEPGPSSAASHGAQTRLYLARAQRLRLNGPDVHGASDLEVTALSPDHVDLEWRPAEYTRADTAPADIQHAQLKVGSRLQIGAASLQVLAIEPETADHPQWIKLEASTADGATR